jgi:DNA-binding SARP family transcriptional activator
MRVLLLGPLQILDGEGGRVAVSGRKRRALLAALAVHAGRTLSASRLVEELWGTTPPAGAANALQAHVGRLRRTIESACGEADRLVTRRPGYRLVLRPGETDAAEFAALVSAARTAPDPIPVLRAALSLWRGPALDGCVLGGLCAPEAEALAEGRLTALEALYDASLRAGRHAEVIAELAETTAAHPLRERFHGQLMTALCRADRRSEALTVYDLARQRLITELGVEPGPALRAHARAIRTDVPQARGRSRARRARSRSR